MKSIELFAGAGGLALSLEQAGFEHIGLIEFNRAAADTLIKNRPSGLLSAMRFSGKGTNLTITILDTFTKGFLATFRTVVFPTMAKKAVGM